MKKIKNNFKQEKFKKYFYFIFKKKINNKINKKIIYIKIKAEYRI